MSRNNLILLLVLTVLLSSCGKVPQAGGEQQGSPIAFSASDEAEGPLNVDTDWSDGPSFTTGLGYNTKAAGEISTVDVLRTGGFGVFACYTGLYHYSESSVTSDFMHNQEVSWDGYGWEYTPVKYWPNEDQHMVSFFAYAPFSDGDPDNSAEGYCIPSFSHAKDFTDPWILYRLHPNPAKQVDLLYTVPILDQKKPETTYKLPFTFKHALSCAGDKVSVSLSDAVKTRLEEMVTGPDAEYSDVQLLLTGVTLECTLLEKARLTLWNRGQANWSFIASETDLVQRSVPVFEGEELLYTVSTGAERSWQEKGCGIYYIPLETSTPQTVSMHVSYIVRTVSLGGSTFDFVHSGDVVLTLNSYPNAFSEGKKLDIHVTLN